MFYILNFIDYDDEREQSPFILKTDMPENQVKKTVKEIIETAKEKWNKDDEADISLSEIVENEIKKIFGKENLINFKHLKFYW
ncbi:hypothetical protein SAMN04244560_00867 [Thermoanaerobacter thermohydrosulfuricus]|uniref:Uncharacterized protein n=1 Tax=Thermoanaerobacter thermohydrosulfuricus TaxID=1516 RepID=A0A1G7LT94_THETY|nr:hypothetical protein [Thermoanaerobacter thermohydrosulfuricus]SDF52663.1 hypothetical protein SAMN04244560_00867 [Thermoanaerobacter thermohydrosulfuricus]